MEQLQSSSDRRKTVECSLLEDDRTLREASVEGSDERAYLLEKVTELYSKLEGALEECIHLKQENEMLKNQLHAVNREQQTVTSESQLSSNRNKALFDMFLQKISKLDEENRCLRENQENGSHWQPKDIRGYGFVSPMHCVQPSSNQSQLLRSSTAKSSLLSSPRTIQGTDTIPTARSKPLQGKLRTSIDQLWNQTAQRQASSFARRS